MQGKRVGVRLFKAFLLCLVVVVNKKEPCIWLAFYRKSRNAVPFLLTPSRSQVGVLNR